MFSRSSFAVSTCSRSINDLHAKSHKVLNFNVFAASRSRVERSVGTKFALREIALIILDKRFHFIEFLQLAVDAALDGHNSRRQDPSRLIAQSSFDKL